MRRLLLVLLLTSCGNCSDENQPIANNDNLRTQPDRDFGSTEDQSSSETDVTMVNDINAPDVDSCTPGSVLSCATDTSRFVCNAAGTEYDTIACAQDEWCLFGECGDQRCVSGTQSCIDPATIGECNSEGTDFINPMPCPESTVCEDNTCKSICDLGEKSFSYIGCEYWTVDLDNYPDPFTNPKPNEVPHAIVISNPGPADATISFNTQDPLVVVNAPDPVVPAGEARAFTIPRRDVSGTGISFFAVQVLSTSPVIAHQFNPLNNANVFSNDASLLLPASENGTEYYVMGWPTAVVPPIFNAPPQHGYVTIVAANGAANVTVTTATDVREGPGIPAMVAGETRVFNLNAGQVLNLESYGAQQFVLYDATGTHIVSDNPVAVFAGHEEAVIGSDRPNRPDDDSCCADHLEQQMFPVDTWGSNYIAPYSPDRGNHYDVWRILSARDGVTITTDPPQEGANNVTLNAGKFVEFESNESFVVNASGPIAVGQYLTSQRHTDDGTGDPAFTLLPAVEQFRSDYFLLTPSGYNDDYVLVLRPTGAVVRLDGAEITETFVAVGASGFERAVVPVEPGVHQLDSDAQFGIIAYGFDNAVSYAYPGGLNLVGLDPDQ